MMGQSHRVFGVCAYAAVQHAYLSSHQGALMESILLPSVTSLARVVVPIDLPSWAWLAVLVGLDVSAAMLGALLPDADHPDSSIAYILGPLWRFVFRVMRFLSPLAGAQDLMEHRGASHSLVLIGFVLGLLALPIYFLAYPLIVILVSLGLGWLSHPLADVLCGGAKIFYPLVNSRISIPRVLTAATGGFGEWFYLLLVVVLTLWLWGAWDFIGWVIQWVRSYGVAF